MNPSLKRKLQSLEHLRLDWDVPLAGYTAFKSGGPVSCLLRPFDIDSLRRAVAVLNSYDFPYFALGRGSNILASEAPIQAAAILMEAGLHNVVVQEESCLVRAQAGVRLSRLLRCCLRHGLGGLEFLVGIPGTVGGAVKMNAGSHGQCLAEVCHSLLILCKDGSVAQLASSELQFSYRHLQLPPGALILEGVFSLVRLPGQAIRSRLRQLLKKRQASQPWQLPSAGSIFKNPPGDYAGRLIEAVGLKGVAVGGAQISPRHANFIVNRGGATAGEVMALIRLAREKVEKETGIHLELEVELLGNHF